MQQDQIRKAAQDLLDALAIALPEVDRIIVMQTNRGGSYYGPNIRPQMDALEAALGATRPHIAISPWHWRDCEATEHKMIPALTARLAQPRIEGSDVVDQIPEDLKNRYELLVGWLSDVKGDDTVHPFTEEVVKECVESFKRIATLTAAAKVCLEGRYTLAEVEKALQAGRYSLHLLKPVQLDDVIADLRRRLAHPEPKPARVTFEAPEIPSVASEIVPRTVAEGLANALRELVGDIRFYESEDREWSCVVCHKGAEMGSTIEHESDCQVGNARAAIAAYERLGATERTQMRDYEADGLVIGDEQLTDEKWKALCRDISDRRGLKWEWNKLDDDVLVEIRKAWSEILFAPRREPESTQEHTYISTACYHGLHDRCRQSCKFCSTPCRCDCGHKAGNVEAPECRDAVPKYYVGDELASVGPIHDEYIVKLTDLTAALETALGATPDWYAALIDVQWANGGFCPQCAQGPAEGHQPKCLIGVALAKAVNVEAQLKERE